MPTVAVSKGRGHSSRTQQSCDVLRLLNYSIISAVAIFLVILLTASNSDPRQQRPGSGITAKQQQQKQQQQQQNRKWDDSDDYHRPVVPMEDDAHQMTPSTQSIDSQPVDGQQLLDDDMTPALNNDDQHMDSQSHASFVDKYCELEGEEWWPTEDWTTRTPYFLLIGAKKAGTTSLSVWISQHPLVVPSRVKELLYFLPFRQPMRDAVTKKVLVKRIRSDIFENDYDKESLMANDMAISFEATPGYVLFSTLSRIPILCTMPWVKLLVTLRSPIDRIFSNYNFLLDYGMKTGREVQGIGPSLDEFINSDIQLLMEAGVLPNDTSDVRSRDFYGSQQERQAWTMYQRLVYERRSEAPVGRSLYILQLQEWYSGLRELGRDPESEILVIRNEDMKNDPDDVYQKILWWLELPSFSPPNYIPKMVTTYHSAPMSNQTRHMLENLFRVYNQRLFDLLGWDYDVWNNNDQHQSTPDKQEGEDVDEDEEDAMEENMSSTELEHMYDPPDYDEAKGRTFTDRWCVLENVSWYPPPHNIWQLRAPYFMLPGAKKSGTTSLASYLMQHPLVENARSKELQFFLNKNFRADYVTDERKTLVKQARSHMYSMDYHSEVLKRNSSLMSFDATPGYLFFSAILPPRILCVAPWIKIIVILRNPVDRAYSNWNFVMWRNNIQPVIPFEQYVHEDFVFLRKNGFLNASTPAEEDATWAKYLAMPTEGPIGRSLYEIQLRQWFQAIRDVGRDPKTQVYILRSEDLKKDIQGEMRKVHRFLGLPNVPVQQKKELVVSSYPGPMKNETRSMLERFFDPYNRRLYKLLVENGFGEDWIGYWDPR
jgi:Sulfotransferase domain